MKRILTIQDISCLGRCSVTIALPVISAMGVETAVLPTALLSTHTMFADYQKTDLAKFMMPFAQQWKNNGIRFDAIYTGYLGTPSDIDIVISIIDMLRNDNTLVFVDPAFGDNGKEYSGIDGDYASHNVKLCAQADYVVPNMTEACRMTGTEYREEYDEKFLNELANKVCGLGPRNAIITGVSLDSEKIGYYGFSRETGRPFSYQNRKIKVSYHGTGDIFASVAVGALVLGKSADCAFRMAADYTTRTIEATSRRCEDPRFGIHFESTLPDLMNMLKAD